MSFHCDLTVEVLFVSFLLVSEQITPVKVTALSMAGVQETRTSKPNESVFSRKRD